MVKSIESLHQRVAAFLTINNLAIFFSYIGVTVFAFWLRIKDINILKNIIFDEKFYVKDGYSILKYGYEKQWVEDYRSMGTKDWETAMSSNSELFASGVYSIASDEYFSTHPPLGKIFIALGMMVAGYDTPLGWRFASIVAGTIVVILTMLLTFIITRKHFLSLLSGVFIAADGLNITMSRLGYLDIFLTMMILVAAIFAYLYIKSKGNYLPHFLLFSVFSGFAMGIKWSTLYFVVAFFILFLVLEFKNNKNWGLFVKLLGKFFIAGVSFLTAYVLTWSVWFISYALPSTGNVSGSIKLFISTHVESLYFLRGTTGRIFNDSYFAEWVLLVRPSLLMYEKTDDSWSVMASIPNLILWYSGWIVLLFMSAVLFTAFIRKSTAWKEVGFIILTILVLWAPWALHYERIMFQYYTVVLMPYLTVLIVYRFGLLFKYNSGKKIVNSFVVLLFTVMVLLFTYFSYPLNAGLPEGSNFYVNVLFHWYEIMKPLKIVFD